MAARISVYRTSTVRLSLRAVVWIKEVRSAGEIRVFSAPFIVGSPEFAAS